MRKESSGHSKQCCTHKSGLNLKVPYFLKWASLVALVVKNPPARARNIRDAGSTPGLRRSPGGGCDNPLQYFYLENPTERGACRQQSIGSQRVGHDWSNLACIFLMPGAKAYLVVCSSSAQKTVLFLKWKWSCSVVSDSLLPLGL